MTTSEILGKYGISRATYFRLCAAGREVAVDPPWGDPIAMEAWYQDHYRSDLANISKQGRRIPDWLDTAVAAAAFSAPGRESNTANEGFESPARTAAPKPRRVK